MTEHNDPPPAKPTHGCLVFTTRTVAVCMAILLLVIGALYLWVPL